MRALLAAGLLTALAAAEAGDQRAAIDYYTRHYDGADIALSRFHCGAPSALRDAAERDAWLACYHRFELNYRAALPVGRSIPPAVAAAMSDAELAAAQRLMNQVFVDVAQQARLQAGMALQAGMDGLSARSASGPRPDLPVRIHRLQDLP